MIEIIGENGYSSFTILKKELKVSTGTIYHHLDTLSQLIEQKSDKKYYLTELGQLAYSSIKENISSLSKNLSNKEFSSPILKGLMFLTPKGLITTNPTSKFIPIAFSTIILIIGVIFSYLNEYFPLFLLFSTFPEDSYLQTPYSNVLGAVFFIVNVLMYYFIIEGIIRLIYKNKDNSLKFFSTFTFIFFPSCIYLALHYYLNLFDPLESFIMGILDNSIMILFQVWSLWILTYSIIIYKRLKIEQALILSLLLHYGGFSLILIISI